ncbi:MAG: TetR/AcrR family transcriptional regulator [Acidimicrobiales bacterium]|nr:TetR/AcrR family transcriptional regulator [Acidimicrobiales bacterium]
MARRKLTIALAPIVAGAVVDPSGEDAVVDVVLDATAGLLRSHGLGGWSVEDVAERARLGRTTVYRRFPSRDDLVHGVLARELRRTIAAIGATVARETTLEGRVVEATLVALGELDGSVVDHLLRREPANVLPLLTTGAGPLIDLARRSMAPALLAAGLAGGDDDAEIAAETLARLGLSFVLTRDTVLPVDDPDELRRAVRRLLAPVLGTGLGSAV